MLLLVKLYYIVGVDEQIVLQSIKSLSFTFTDHSQSVILL